MNEFLICNSCSARINTFMQSCEFCGSEYRNEGDSYILLKLRDEIDRNISNLKTHQEILKLIDSSKYRLHPIIIFRKAKILFIDLMFNDIIFDSQKFCNVVNIVHNISNHLEDYWGAFSEFISNVSSSSSIQLYFEDYEIIVSFLKQKNLDSENVIKDILMEKLLISEVGQNFINEYKFYANNENFINDENFVNKRKYLVDKYDSIKIKITNKLI